MGDSSHDNTLWIKAEALRLGFNACGVAAAEPVDEGTASYYEDWLRKGFAGDMGYLERNVEMRCNPALLVDGTKSIVSLALNYYPKKCLPEDTCQLAYYAYGKDYHQVMREKLTRLLAAVAERTGAGGRLFCDTAPVFERYWAHRAGLGWIGKNRQLIIPASGSFFFLGELFLDIDLEYDTPIENGCGDCHRCLQTCPTGALTEQGLQAHRCLSYLTIEHKGSIGVEASKALGGCIYGCDRCQKVCPHNKGAAPTTVDDFKPSQELLDMRPDDWRALSRDDYNTLFKGSAVKRCKYEGLMRNITAALPASPEEP